MTELIEIFEGYLKNLGYFPKTNEIKKYIFEAAEYFGTQEFSNIPVTNRNKMILTRARNMFERDMRQAAPAPPEDDNALFFQKLNYLEAQRKLPPATAPQVAPEPIPAPTPDILMPAPAPTPLVGGLISPAAIPVIINSADRKWDEAETARDIWTWAGPLPNSVGASMRFVKIIGPTRGTAGKIVITGVGGQTETVVYDEFGDCVGAVAAGLGVIKPLSLPWKIAIKGFNGGANLRGRDGWRIQSIEFDAAYNHIYLDTPQAAISQEFTPGDECWIGPTGPAIKIHGIGANGNIIVAGPNIKTPIVGRPVINLSRQLVLIFAATAAN